MTENKKEEQINTSEDVELKKIVKKNLELNLEMIEMLKDMKRHIVWQRVFGLLKLLIIIVPIALGVIYLPPIFEGLLEEIKTFFIDIKAGWDGAIVCRQKFFFVKKIKRGEIATYKQVARVVGSPQSARAIGNALNKNKDIINIPCHRVVRSNGFVGGYNGGSNLKITLLKKEGINIKQKRVIDLEKYLLKDI